MTEPPPSFAPANPRPRPTLPTPPSPPADRQVEPGPGVDEGRAGTASPLSPGSPISPTSAPEPTDGIAESDARPATTPPRIRPARLNRRTPPVELPGPPARPAPTVSTGLADRLAERSAALRARRMRLVGIGAGALLVLGFLGWVVGFSPWLALEESEIAITGGSAQASTEEIAAFVTPAVGTPIARLDTAGMVAGIESIIGVKEATITRSWPHGLEVDVVARKPEAAVEHEGAYVVVDADGVELNHLEEAPEGLPVVEVPIGDLTGPTVEAALTVMASLADDVEVAAVSATGPESIRLELADGARVEWGSAEESDLKAAVLETLLQVEASVYNVAEPLSPTTS
ncbi:FtsQ-type POTRA domain-containing protein [Pseudactinotalea sp. HY160]|uniref:cell division protein FtsQ/DivIB n=1 Tax=Pseudactinotalea sp. HY160 TaxID=2654490 RepID=UPI00128C9A44|nr:cell division protein FtsQ/DivIB [Pseudactinotalea sp. HY160]MPV49517.1 FtsQ-type POTRA domain-containing protein [Pseudactinotalea sp. HY160]